MNNAVVGVTEGWKRELDIVGVGYRAELKGKQVVLALGYSHPIVFDVPTGIEVAIEKQTHSPSPASTASWSVRWRRTCDGSASRTRISRRVCATPVKC